jgi:RND family efflux transporter MFP subunit
MSTTIPQKHGRASDEKDPPARDALASLRIDRDESRTPRKWRRRMLLLGLLIVAGVGGWFGYRWSDASGLLSSSSVWVPEIMQNRVEVRLESVTVQKGRSADAVVVATGYLESRRQAKIGARAAGRIDAIFFEEGDRVSKGEILAELDHKDLDASLAAAAASVELAKATLVEQEIAIELALADKVRAERLWESRSSAESEYDQAQFGYRTALARKSSLEADIALAEARRQQAEQLRENMFIRAPFDGTVISKDAEHGESILPGGMGGGSGRGSVATIADLDHLEIECDVQEDFISRVIEGQEAEIAVDAVPDKRYHGTVRKIIPMGDRARATIKVQVEIIDADALLFPEMAGTVFFLPTAGELEISDEPRIFCPTSSVVSDDEGNRSVWVADRDQRAVKVAVDAGDDRDGQTEILAGLTGNERVVVNPQGLQQGTPLNIIE